MPLRFTKLAKELEALLSNQRSSIWPGKVSTALKELSQDKKTAKSLDNVLKEFEADSRLNSTMRGRIAPILQSYVQHSNNNPISERLFESLMIMYQQTWDNYDSEDINYNQARIYVTVSLFHSAEENDSRRDKLFNLFYETLSDEEVDPPGYSTLLRYSASLLIDEQDEAKFSDHKRNIFKGLKNLNSYGNRYFDGLRQVCEFIPKYQHWSEDDSNQLINDALATDYKDEVVEIFSRHGLANSDVTQENIDKMLSDNINDVSRGINNIVSDLTVKSVRRLDKLSRVKPLKIEWLFLKNGIDLQEEVYDPILPYLYNAQERINEGFEELKSKALKL